MDKFDKKIISALRRDARRAVSSIAEDVNLSRTAVSDRIKKMEKTGIIRGYQVLLSESQKTEVSAYFEILHCDKNCRNIALLLSAIPEVQLCHSVSGVPDLFVYVKTGTISRLHEIREYLDGLEEIRSIKTHVVMSEWVNLT